MSRELGGRGRSGGGCRGRRLGRVGPGEIKLIVVLVN